MSTTQTELEWYGNTFTWSDLEEALAVLVAPSFKPSDVSAQQSTMCKLHQFLPIHIQYEDVKLSVQSVIHKCKLEHAQIMLLR